jgi:small subunit ribosomal protein S8
VAKLQYASFKYSRLIESVCVILKEDGYILDYDVFGDGISKLVRVKLTYYKGVSAIQKFNVISKPSRRLYVKSKDLKPYKNGMGLMILSTSSGVMSYRDAVKEKVGGEMLCVVF